MATQIFKPRVLTTSSEIYLLAYKFVGEWPSTGCTLFVKNTIIKSLSLSAHIIVPVYPVWPKEFNENRVPQGGFYWIGTVSQPSALLLL